MAFRRISTVLTLIVAIAAAAAVALGAMAVNRQRERREWASMLTGGDPDRAPALMIRYGCAGCHDIRGVRGPGGKVGPSLSDVGQQVFIAGVLTNTPENLLHWIVNPREVDPKTAMPVTGISEAEARHVAAYLYALR